ncbi:hypothetical protein [Viridibacterium curvum]|uniref:Uncharacterized protein n=1 Tax=Viridibacterium curvum TaxID=1101404 RepID=A0ABP9Q746_9RHOO
MASTTTRTRRSSIERRCLSKFAKRLYKGMPRSVLRSVYQAECHSKQKKPL